MQEVSHSGIKGQKWGVRRFQNEDGSLTTEGKNRYGANEGIISRKKTSPPFGAITEGPTHNTSPQERWKQKDREKTQKILSKTKDSVINRKTTKSENADKEAKMAEHRKQWMNGMLVISASVINQLHTANAMREDPKYKKFYNIMGAVNMATLGAGAAIAFKNGLEYDKLKHPERYKKKG